MTKTRFLFCWYACLLVVSLMVPSVAPAKHFETLTQNHFTTGQSLDAGLAQAGVQYSAGEGYQSFYPVIRYGLGAFFELGGRAGFSSVDVGSEDKVAEMVGIDMKYQMIKRTKEIPVDMAIDLGYDTQFVDGKNVSELSFAALLSRSYPLTERGYKITPYGGMEFTSIRGSYFDKTDTNVYVFAGAEWRTTQKAMVYFEVKAGSNTVGGFGVRFEY